METAGWIFVFFMVLVGLGIVVGQILKVRRQQDSKAVKEPPPPPGELPRKKPSAKDKP
jgi:hypothetical protein